MRRPTSALAAAFLGTALAATSVSAQQQVPSLLGDNPAPASPSGALTPATTAPPANEASRPPSAGIAPEAGQAPPLSTAVNPARTARTLVRNGWDFITYQEYDRALVFFKEADSRKAELTNAERTRLKQGIAKAQQAIRAAAQGVKTGPAYALSAKKAAGRPPAAKLSDEPLHDVDAMASASRMKNINNAIPTALQAALHEKDMVELPPLADDRPRADDQLSRASGDNEPPAVTAAPSGRPPTLVPDPSAELLPEPVAARLTANDLPTPAATPEMPPLPALPVLPPPSDLIAPEPAAPETSAALPELPPSVPLAGLQPEPRTPEPEMAAAAPVMTESPAPLQEPSAGLTPAPGAESLPPLPASIDDAPAPEAPGTPSPIEPTPSANPSASEVPSASASASAPAAAENPIEAPVDTRNTSRGVFGRDTLIPERRTLPSHSSLTPELQREVEEVARKQEEDSRRDRASQPPAGVPEEEPLPGLPGTSITTKLEISRAPSSTEARPIKAIPVPEEFVPLPKREWNPNRKFWAAAATCHMPLYFQDASLERYGYSMEQRIGPVGRFFSYPIDDPRQSKQRNQLLQPFSSLGLFAIQIAFLPYNLIMDPPWEAEYDLGYYRPGDRVPTDVFYLPLTGVGPPLHGRNYGKARPRAASLPASRW